MELRPNTTNDGRVDAQTSEGRRGDDPLLGPFLFVLVVAAVWYLCGTAAEAVRHSAPAQQAQKLVEDVVPEPVRNTISYIVKPGDTFAGVLSKFGVPLPDVHAYYKALVPLGMNALFPGDKIAVTLNSSGSVDTLTILNRLENWYNVAVDGLGITARRKPLVGSVYRCCIKGVLENSLSEDMCALGAGDALVARLTDIFAWDINFFTDPRRGDRFEVIFEKRYAEGEFLGYGDILAARYIMQSGQTFHAVSMRDAEGVLRYYDQNGKSVQKQFLKAPLRFSRISSRYSYARRHPILGIVRPHLGIDYAAPLGTPVYASAEGTVVFAGADGGFGRVVRIAHGGSYETTYGHLSSIARGIERGARVCQGQQIGAVGSSGLSTGSHLDYRMCVAGRFVNPQTISPPSAPGVARQEQARFERLRDQYVTTLDVRFGASEGMWVLDIQKEPEPAASESATLTLSHPINAGQPGS